MIRPTIINLFREERLDVSPLQEAFVRNAGDCVPAEGQTGASLLAFGSCMLHDHGVIGIGWELFSNFLHP